MFRTETIGNSVTLYLGDSREIIPALPRVQATVTDPPYGVSLGSGKKNNNRDRAEYLSFDDTPENIVANVLPIIEQCRQISDRVVFTPGVRNLFRYPAPDHVGAIYYPAGAGCNSWGFSCWQPILYYGKDPHGGKGSRPDSFESTESAEKNGHPCPKPIGQMLKIAERSTVRGETILDPFMGSGTTGVAAVRLGRQFIGIELEEKYFDIACKRIEYETRQQDFFVEKPKPAKQEAML
jgi:site-specific DNA-methyltransferase (adenine-specific)